MQTEAEKETWREKVQQVVQSRLEPATEYVKVEVVENSQRVWQDSDERQITGYTLEARDATGRKFIDIRVGPLYDGSGRRETYPEGVIRSIPEARRIAEQLAAAINATGGIAL